MENNIQLLILTAASLAFIHTVLGPDHYLPFVVISRARNWPLAKTVRVTLLCGTGHVLSSFIIGMIGVALGFGLNRVAAVEAFRGDLAAWLIILFGAGYMTWGIYRARTGIPHAHSHLHNGGKVHGHIHSHSGKHDHIHNKTLTPFLLVVIFVLGPCESLVPLLMYPAANQNIWGIIQVALVFSLITVLTMLAIVILLTFWFKKLPFGRLEKHMHTIAGATIMVSGLAIVFLGL